MAVKLQTIKDFRNYLIKELSGIYPERESSSIAELVITEVFGFRSRTEFLTRSNEIPDSVKADTIIEYCNLLKAGRPVQYVLGETSFYDCRIKITPGILIPRPETEELVDRIIRDNYGFSGNILDIGTGSGCIAIALARNLPLSRVTGIDISQVALDKASENASLNNVDVRFLKADILKPSHHEIPATGIIVSNPPYIRESEKRVMHSNVLDFEPHEALFVPDNDPLLYYRAILKAANEILEPPGRIYFEINEAMGKEIVSLMGSFDCNAVEIIKDLNGKDRIAKATKS
jgi:release factor glutamine methyltransferase